MRGHPVSRRVLATGGGAEEDLALWSGRAPSAVRTTLAPLYERTIPSSVLSCTAESVSGRNTLTPSPTWFLSPSLTLNPRFKSYGGPAVTPQTRTSSGSVNWNCVSRRLLA